MFDDKTRGIIYTYLELSPSDQSRAITRLIAASDACSATPPPIILVARHIRLRLALGDFYDELGHYALRVDQESADYFRDGYNRCQRDIQRTYALLAENNRRAEAWLHPEAARPSQSLVQRLRQHHQTRRARPAIQITELEPNR